ncbi:ATP-binding protein [Streptomyces rectiviolaceus]|uniref:Histidine kinase/HSP90-like ATPase domain-containing protein n=1 Tax=Streptomyces rectiviolaceus TaxID=332591 RepID=A0ABP6MFN7_9ACTN
MILNRGIGNDDNGGDPALHREHIDDALAPVPGRPTLLELPFTMSDLARLRLQVTRRAEDAGLCEPRLSDFVLAVHEVASNAVVHGGGKGRIHLAHTDAGLRCVIADSGPGLTRPKPCESAALPDADDADEAENGRGLWLAQALTDHFDVAVCEAGTMVTLVALLS